MSKPILLVESLPPHFMPFHLPIIGPDNSNKIEHPFLSKKRKPAKIWLVI